MAFVGQYSKSLKDTTKKPDTTLLAKADSSLTYVERKLPNPNAKILYYHANVKNFEDGDRNNIKGYAKPLYEQYVQLLTSKGDTTAADNRQHLAEAYAYLGNYALYKDKNDAQALDYFIKARDMDPTNDQVVYYFETTGKGAKKSK
jgi:tetratricopeptide (TPR) repeat protein